MRNPGDQTVVVVAGLPYSGKTSIIESLLREVPGTAIYIDAVFREFVEEKDVCLENWLAHGDRLVDRIIEHIESTQASVVCIEIGILQSAHRRRLVTWIRSSGRSVSPILLECRSRDAVAQRISARMALLAREQDSRRIAIGMEELEGPITAAFQEPDDGEKFLRVDTSVPIAESIGMIRAALLR